MSIATFIPKVILNRFLIWSKLDRKVWSSDGHWKHFRYDPARSAQQNAGFSHTPEVDETLQRVKDKLIAALNQHVDKGNTILDFGCGPGIYMKMLDKDYHVVGVDISDEMLQSASRLMPENKFYCGDFLDIHYDERFSAIYSIGALEYISVSRIHNFFKKCADILNPKGLLFIQYPHAVRIWDLFYPNLSYINYSPKLISRIASRYFQVLENCQAFDGRPACWYDKHPYPTSTRIVKNGYLLIAKKK